MTVKMTTFTHQPRVKFACLPSGDGVAVDCVMHYGTRQLLSEDVNIAVKHVLLVYQFVLFCTGKIARALRFNHESAFYTNNNIVKSVDEQQIRGTNSNRKFNRKYALPCLASCALNMSCSFDQSARSIESRCVVTILFSVTRLVRK